MELSPSGHPIHTRALSVVATQASPGCVTVTGSILDLRKRGFCPVGSELQGMGIIHHMELRLAIDAGARKVLRVDAAQPTVAFEATPATQGESCRDPVARLIALHDVALGEPFTSALRIAGGGPLGCSHLVTLAQFI